MVSEGGYSGSRLSQIARLTDSPKSLSKMISLSQKQQFSGLSVNSQGATKMAGFSIAMLALIAEGTCKLISGLQLVPGMKILKRPVEGETMSILRTLVMALIILNSLSTLAAPPVIENPIDPPKIETWNLKEQWRLDSEEDEEIADIYILASQIHNNSAVIQDLAKYKIKRTQKRIKENYYE